MAKEDSATVTVMSKLPKGLVLDCVIGGEQRSYTINGCAQLRGDDLSHAVDRGEAVKPLHGGYAMTPDVPREIWDGWKARMAGSPMLQQNLVFAMSDSASASSKAREMAEVKAPFAPLRPDAPGTGVKPYTTKDKVA
jgi:hypothetical protein